VPGVYISHRGWGRQCLGHNQTGREDILCAGEGREEGDGNYLATTRKRRYVCVSLHRTRGGEQNRLGGTQLGGLWTAGRTAHEWYGGVVESRQWV